MRYIFFGCLAVIVLLGCRKKDTPTIEQDASVEVYLLTSYNIDINPTTYPTTLIISNAILADAPLIANQDIEFYQQSTTTFKLKKNINSIINEYDSKQAFAVTVNKKPVYYGQFHPLYLNSITFGLAIVNIPAWKEGECRIEFPMIDGSADLQQLDKRNDDLIIKSLKASGRLR
jgi:hypothetical protein